MGDLRAQIAAVNTGKRRVNEMLERYGESKFTHAINNIFKQSEHNTREKIKQIPDGIYEAESYMDDDGVTIGKPIKIGVKVTISGDQIEVDLSNIDNQVAGFFNSGWPAGVSAAQVALKCLVAPLESPINDGCFKPLTVILPEGKVVNAVRPAPMRMWMTYPMTVIDTIFKALSVAIPTQVAAAHHADLVVANINGRDPKNSKLFIYLGGLIGGGWGAKHNEDGMSATIAINDGDTHNGPSEQVEAKYPFIVRKYQLRQDSGGAGKQRGGMGTEQYVEVMSDTMFNSQIEKVENRPWGLFGGLFALGNQVAIKRKGEEEVNFSSGKLFSQLLLPGDIYVLRSGGGGGYGKPIDRKLENVENDYQQGYISLKSAKSEYGVVLDPMTGKAILDKTARLRSFMKHNHLPKDFSLTSKDPNVQKSKMTHTKACPIFTRLAEDLEKEIESSGLMSYRCCS